MTNVTSPAPGALTLQGQFFSNETIKVFENGGTGLVAQGTPASNRNSFTLTGFPSGQHVYTIEVSCAAGTNIITTFTGSVS